MHNSYPIMNTDGSGGEFLAQYPQVIKLWKQYFQDRRSKYHVMYVLNKFDDAVSLINYSSSFQ